MVTTPEKLAYAIVERDPHKEQRFAVILEHADGFRHPIRRFRTRAEADQYRSSMIDRCLHGYEFGGIWTPSQLILATVRECTVITCYK
ncbi:MAG: hypothetical protein ACI3YH_09240 [Eubacteriales bacterium]